MSKFYVVIDSYSPNTAVTNRCMGMIKQFSARYIDTEVVYFTSDIKGSKAPQLPHIKYHYYWEKLGVKNSKIQNLLSITVYSWIFCQRVKAGDIVYLYGCNQLVNMLVGKEGVKVYQERTEYPAVSKLRFSNMEKYLRSCTKLTGLFVISNQLKSYFESVGVDNSRIHVINMTVDRSRFIDVKRTESERYIAYCGKATNNKDGVDELIKAFAITSKKYSDVKLYIIGTPPKRSDESGNIELVERLGISDKVVFTGTVSANEMPQILKNAEILALDRPDNIQAKYGFPTKLGEYLLTGNPVVITSVGDIPLFLRDGYSALIAEPNSSTDFSEKLNWVLENPVKSHEIGAQGRKVAELEFDSQTEANKIIKVIHGI